MALGSNIKYQLQAVFEAAFDEKSAKQVEQMYDKMSKRVAESTRQEFVAAFQEFGTVLNNALQKLNIQPIDMNKLIELPNAQMFSQLGSEFGAKFAEGFNGVASGGINIDIGKQLKQLNAEREKLFNRQKKLQKGASRVEYLSELPDLASMDEVKPFSSDQIKELGKTVDEVALKMQGDFTKAEDELYLMKRGTVEYQQALIKAYEAASNLYRMKGYIDQNKNKIQDKTILADYNHGNLADITSDLFDNYHKDLRKVEDTYYEPQLAKVSTRLKEIDGQIKQIQQNNPDIINEEAIGVGLKTLEEVEAAYQRILNAHGKVGKQGKSIQGALDFDPSTSKQGIQALYDAYTKMPVDSPWEVEYQALLKYVRLYESYLTSENLTHRRKTENPQFKALYKQLKPMATNAENMLRNVLNVANNQPLVGMGGAEAENNVAVAAQLTAETQNQAEAEAKSRAEAEAKARAEKEAAEAAEKEKLSQEAAAKAAQQSAVASEKERVSKEAAAKASKETSLSDGAGSIFDNPAFANMFSKVKNEAEEKQVANEASAKAAQEELGVAQKTTLELEKQQKLLLYRRVEGQLDINRIGNRSDDALYNKQGQPIIQDALEMGYGGYGDGLYGSVLSSAKDLIPKVKEGPVSFFEFDASAYNLYINKTVEQAEALRTFLLSLQKLVGSGTLLDGSQLTDIESLSEQQLFEKAQQVFNNFSMTKEQFHTWLENAKIESEKIASMFAKGETPTDRHNFGTRFMKALGYEGVLNQTGDIEYDGNTQGSVIYDPDVNDIKKNARVFNNEKEFAQYIKANAQAHQENANAINTETQAQEKLNGAKVQQTQIEQSDNDGAEVAEENAKTEAIKQQNGALQENINLKTQANAQGSITGIEGIGSKTATPNGVTVGEVTELETVRSKVAEITAAVNTKNQAFYNEGQIVGQVIGKENAALISLKSNIEAITSAINTKTQAFIKEELVARQSIGKENSALIQLRNNVSNVSASLSGTLGNLQGIQMPNLSGTTSQGDIVNETQVLENLRTKISEVTSTIKTKTAAFVQEEMAVRQGVGREVAALTQMETRLQNVVALLQQVQTLSGNTLNVNVNNQGNTGGSNNNRNSAPQSQGDAQEQERLVNQWLRLTDRMATLRTQIDSGAFDEIATTRLMQQYENLRAQVDRIRASIQTTDDVWNRIGNAYVDGRDTASTTMASNALPQLAKLYQQLGVAQANFEGKETSATETAVRQIREKIAGQQRSLQLSQEELAILQQIASVAYRNQAEMLQSSAKDNRIKEWGSLVSRLESLNTQINSGEFDEAQVRAMQSEVDLISRRVDELRPLIDMAEYNWNAMGSAVFKGREKGEDAILKQQAKNFKEQVRNSQKEAGLTKSRNVATKANETLASAMAIDGISPEQISNLELYSGKIKTLESTIANFPKNGLASEEEKQRLISQRMEVDNYTKEIQELIANYQRLSGPNAQSLNATSKLGLGATAGDYQKELTNAVQSFHKGRASIKSFDAETNTLTYTLKTGKGEFTQYAASVRQTDGALMSVRGTTTRAMGVFESIGKKIKEYSYYFTGSMMIYRVIAWVREGITAVQDIDKAMTELKKVTDETEESYDKFLDTAEKTAKKVGSTVKDVVSSTADWARLGYSMEEATKMAESTQILMNVSEFDDISKATDTLISSIQAFKYTAEESMDVVDILNTIGKQICRGYIVIYNRADNVKRLKTRDGSDRVKLNFSTCRDCLGYCGNILTSVVPLLYVIDKRVNIQSVLTL